MGIVFITINGHLGSGKSTVCALLKEQYGFKVFHTGIIQREFANKMNISTLALNKKSKNDFSFDHYIDNATVEYAKSHIGEKIVFDSRLAWHFVPDSFKICLTINPEIAANRVFLNRQTKEETYSSIQDAMEQLAERQKAEADRYQSIYGIDINDVSNYDLTIDTSDLSPSGVAQKIIIKYKQFLQDSLTNVTQAGITQNCFISREYTDGSIPYSKDVTTISMDDIIQNLLSTIKGRCKEKLNTAYYDLGLLVIDNFQNCNGKEITQKAVVDLLTYRIQNKLSTHLLCNSSFTDLKSISKELNEIINNNFSFLP